MPTASANGLTLAYETSGDPTDPAVLLIMGLGGQLIDWPDPFCAALADQGFFVVRFDNRDVGLSTKLDDAPVGDVRGAMAGRAVQAAYTLADMAGDAAGLLDALGIDAAHVVGASLGGMIAQHVALGHPHRVLTLCSIMSAPAGNLMARPPSEAAAAVLLAPPPRSREEAIQAAQARQQAVGSPLFPTDPRWVTDQAGRAYDRCFHPSGIARQLLAMLAAGDWSSRLSDVRCPSLVIHGEDDPLVRPAWGKATAEAIPGARLVLVPGLGHDLPESFWSRLIDHITTLARAGSTASRTPCRSRSR